MDVLLLQFDFACRSLNETSRLSLKAKGHPESHTMADIDTFNVGPNKLFGKNRLS